MPKTVTKADLNHVESGLRETIHNVADGLRETFKENTREIIGFVQKSQRIQDASMQGQFKKVDERFNLIDVQLKDIAESLAWREELRNLVREIKAHGMPLDESKIFA